MSEGSNTSTANPDFRAKLLRERFVIKPKKKGKTTQEPLVAMANRLNFSCFDHTGEKKADFIIRAQNIHTCLKIGARVVEQWYNHGHLNKTGKDRFNWDQVYLDAVKEYEQRWNPDCWACVYQNGRVIRATKPPENSDVLNIIEQVFTHEKCAYQHIPWVAERLFNDAGRQVEIEYDGNVAMELYGNNSYVKSHIMYRDVEGRSELQLDMSQKTSRYVRGAKGAKVKMHETLDMSAILFEGLQLGFIVGKSNYEISKGIISLGHRNAVQADFALRRIKQLEGKLEALQNMHNIVFKPKPDFYTNIKNIEHSFKEKAHA